MPVLLLPIAALLGFSVATKSDLNTALTTAQESKKEGINLTTVAGYAILGGLAFYFGKKLVK